MGNAETRFRKSLRIIVVMTVAQSKPAAPPASRGPVLGLWVGAGTRHLVDAGRLLARRPQQCLRIPHMCAIC